MAKYGRLIIDLGYVVDLSNEDMIRESRLAFIEDLISAQKYGRLPLKIKLIEDDKVNELDIPDHIKEILEIDEENNTEKWFRLNKDHRLWEHAAIGTIFSCNQKDEIMWYNMDGFKWKGEFSKEDIDYWEKFGFEECTKEEAIKSFPKEFKLFVVDINNHENFNIVP
jgi:hypothetical protein